jgi:hypothetical protein
MKAADVREAIKHKTAVAIGRGFVRGEVPTTLRQAIVLKIDGRKARVRYVDNGTLGNVNIRDIYNVWQESYKTRAPVQPKPEGPQETEVRKIPLGDIFIPYSDELFGGKLGYQRKRTEEEAMKLALNPDVHRWEFPHVSDRTTTDEPLGPNGERYALLDGVARYHAHELLLRKVMRCEVHIGLSHEAEAKLCHDLWRGRKPHSSGQSFQEMLVAGDAMHVAIDKILKGGGYRIGGTRKSHSAVRRRSSACTCSMKAASTCKPHSGWPNRSSRSAN